MPRRIKRPEEKSDLFQLLTDKNKSGIFDTYKDVMLFAAALGAYHKKSKKMEKSDEAIDYSIFSRNSDNEALIFLLSLFKHKEIDILSEKNADKRIEILEDYATAGLELMQRKIYNSVTVLDGILDLIYEAQFEEKDTDRNFTKLLEQFKNA